MPRYFDTLPDELPCLVCHLTLPVTAFRRLHYPGGTLDGRGAHTVYDGCSSCQAHYKKGTLTPAQLRRWIALGEQARHAETHRKRAVRRTTDTERAVKMRTTYEAKTGVVSPYDQAVAELEAAWGKPVKDWTLAEDRLCTLRIYEILGWPVTQTVTDQQHSREVHAAAVRAYRAKEKAARAKVEAAITDDEELLAYA